MSVKNGVITSISPTAITAFDETTAFGCQRRWWFKYVAGLKEPTSPEMVDGLAVHAISEHDLLGLADQPEILFSMSEGERDWLARLTAKGQVFRDEIRSEVIGIEAPMPPGFNIAGIPISSMSKCDVVTREPGIIDWKTTSSIEKYGKTPGQLRKDTQMVIYARAFHPNEPKVRLTHGQYETSGTPRFNAASVLVEKNQLDEFYEGTIIPLVEKMKTAARVEAAREMKPNRNACRLCPHRGICPPDKENPLMGIFNKFKATTTETPAAPSKPEPQILPPDAPASSPELNAKPVEGFENKRTLNIVDEKPEAAPEKVEVKEEPKVEEPAVEKKGPGRPKGSKNKPKEEASINVANLNPVADGSQYAQFSETTVNYGVTMNLGDYNSVRIDVSHTIKHSGNADEAFTQAINKAKEQVEAEMEKVHAGMKKGGK